MSTAPGSVLITPGAAELRRDLGPVAWVVAEALVSRAAPDAQGSLVATTGIRSLANDLGLDKDTVARALRRLKVAGLVARVDRGPAGYAIRSIHGLVALDILDPRRGPSSTVVSRPRKGDGVSRPISGDRPVSEAELSTESAKATSPVPQNDAANTLHRTHTTQINAATPHQQSLFPPSGSDTNNTAEPQSVTALSESATTNSPSSSSQSSTPTSPPTDSCHPSMAEGAGPATPEREAARKLGDSSHPTPASTTEAAPC